MRLVDADELKKYPIRLDHYDKEHGDVNFVYGIESVLEYVDSMPTIEAEPIRYGTWEHVDGYFGDAYYRCSVCKKESYFSNHTPGEIGIQYCHYCGAKILSGSE